LLAFFLVDRFSLASGRYVINTAIVLALVSMFGLGGGFVLTQFGLRWIPPSLGAAFSIPSSTLLFWCAAPFFLNPGSADVAAALLFACVGLFFPGTVALLNFESNRLMGPNIAGTLSSTTPLFAVLLAVLFLGETLSNTQVIALAAIVGGVAMTSWGRGEASSHRSAWLLALPLTASAGRGLVQPIIKLGLAWWPNPIAAVVIGYTVSSAVLVISARLRSEGRAAFDRRGAMWFVAVGICNGLAVLAMYAALGKGPVTVVSPLIASYPLVTLGLSRFFLKSEPIRTLLMSGVAVTVGGVILLILT
jgi:drug/metabolite transporter (DMT)-like permease